MTEYPSSTISPIVSSVKYYALCLSIIELMSSESDKFGNWSSFAVPLDTTYTGPVNCQWGTCMEQFSSIIDLGHHIEVTHIPKGSMKDYVCLWRSCLWKRKPSKDQCRLVNHFQFITGEKPNKCTVSPPTVITGTVQL